MPSRVLGGSVRCYAVGSYPRAFALTTGGAAAQCISERCMGRDAPPPRRSNASPHVASPLAPRNSVVRFWMATAAQLLSSAVRAARESRAVMSALRKRARPRSAGARIGREECIEEYESYLEQKVVHVVLRAPVL